MSFMLSDGPGRRGGGRDGRDGLVSLHKCVGTHATELHDVEQFGEVLCTDPNREKQKGMRGSIAWKRQKNKLFNFVQISLHLR